MQDDTDHDEPDSGEVGGRRELAQDDHADHRRGGGEQRDEEGIRGARQPGHRQLVEHIRDDRRRDADTDARRDLQTGNTDLALQEFQQYLTYFPNTELAASAQYYIGEILFRRSDYTNAIPAFDAVLERYPENPKTADAHFMKGMALLKAGQRNRAVQDQ